MLSAFPSLLPSAVASPEESASRVLFFDDFESYAEGSDLTGQGGWSYGGLPYRTQRITIVSPGYQSERGAAALAADGQPNDFKMYRNFAGTNFERLTGRLDGMGQWISPAI